MNEVEVDRAVEHSVEQSPALVLALIVANNYRALEMDVPEIFLRLLLELTGGIPN